MNELLKLLKALSKKGFATKAEKTKVKELVDSVEAEDAEVLKDDVDAVNKLPEKDPAESEESDEEAEEIVKSISDRVFSKASTKIEKTIADAQDKIEKDLEAWKKEQADKADKGVGIHAPGVQIKREKVNTYMRGLMKSIVDNDIAKIKEMTTGNPGEYLVDSELSFEIRTLMTDYGVARREFFTTQLSKNAYEANVLTTDVIVSWVAEGAVIPTVSLEVTPQELKLKKLAAIATMTRELLEDSEIDLFAFIGQRVAEGFAKAEDRAFFMGEGAGDTTNGEFLGLAYNPDITDISVADKGGLNDGSEFYHADADDFLAMQDALIESAHANAKYYFHRTIMSVVRKMKDGNGSYIYQAPSVTGPATLWGKPVVFVEVMPSVTDSAVDTPFALFGDLRKATILGYRGGIAVDRFNAGVVRNAANNADVNLITTDREAVRWVERVGAITIQPQAVVRLKTQANS